MKVVRAVLFEESNGSIPMWVGQCLELDIASQSHSREDIIYELERAIACTAIIGMELGHTPFEGIGEAPINFFKMWENPPQGVEAVTLDIPEIAEKFTTDSVENWAEAV